MHHLLPCAITPSLPELRFLGDLGLARGRMHEFCGDARQMLALIVAQACNGPLFWLSARNTPDHLYGLGMSRYIDPARLHLIRTPDFIDTLWAAEETLRSGQSPLVIIENAAPLALTPVRRLHLAAQTGAQGRRKSAPLGVILSPGDGGAQGIDSRWQMRACDGGGASPRWKLTRLQARSAPPKSWHVQEKDGQAYLT